MHKVEYMEWVKLRKRTQYEIGGSGVTAVHLDEFPEARDVVEINDFNLYGYRPLVREIAQRYEVKPEQVVTTQGCSMANYLVCAALLRPGDEVLVEKPAYEPLLGVPKLLGAKVKRFRRPFRKGFAIDVDDLKDKLNRHTKLVVLSNMHNPSGVLTGNDELKEIGRVAGKAGAHVLVDEVYLDFLSDRPRSSVHLGDNFAVTASLTKAYGLDGLRCGWILASPKLAEACWRVQDFMGVNGAIPAEKISTAAFQNIERFGARTRGIIASNWPLVQSFIEARREKLDWVAPDGGPVCFPKLLDGDVDDLVERLKTEFDTGVIPGKFFEMPRHFRMGFGGSTATLREGLERLGRALA